jgi:hypothetical protein
VPYSLTIAIRPHMADKAGVSPQNLDAGLFVMILMALVDGIEPLASRILALLDRVAFELGAAPPSILEPRTSRAPPSAATRPTLNASASRPAIISPGLSHKTVTDTQYLFSNSRAIVV